MILAYASSYADGTGSTANVETVNTNGVSHEESYWQQKLALVHKGMRREDVERILPPYTEPRISATSGGMYGLGYLLDEHWRVAMTYDVTGLRGKTETNRFAENCLFDVPKIGRIRPDKQELESICAFYHRQHHQEDEKIADALGCVEFTGYNVSVGDLTNDEAVVGIKVSVMKQVGSHCEWESTEPESDWQERWRISKGEWVFVNRLTKPSGIKIIR